MGEPPSSSSYHWDVGRARAPSTRSPVATRILNSWRAMRRPTRGKRSPDTEDHPGTRLIYFLDVPGTASNRRNRRGLGQSHRLPDSVREDPRVRRAGLDFAYASFPTPTTTGFTEAWSGHFTFPYEVDPLPSEAGPAHEETLLRGLCGGSTNAPGASRRAPAVPFSSAPTSAAPNGTTPLPVPRPRFGGIPGRRPCAPLPLPGRLLRPRRPRIVPRERLSEGYRVFRERALAACRNAPASSSPPPIFRRRLQVLGRRETELERPFWNAQRRTFRPRALRMEDHHLRTCDRYYFGAGREGCPHIRPFLAGAVAAGGGGETPRRYSGSSWPFRAGLTVSMRYRRGPGEGIFGRSVPLR